MLFIHDDDQQSYRGNSLLPFGLRRRRPICFAAAPHRCPASQSSPLSRISTRRRSQRGSRDFYHGLLVAPNMRAAQ
jgi:hypothetical protein